jgi:hypothetical protein
MGQRFQNGRHPDYYCMSWPDGTTQALPSINPPLKYFFPEANQKITLNPINPNVAGEA